MFSPCDYQLLDFGGGRRLERFGGVTLDRPCPAAERFSIAHPKMWADAHLRFEETEKNGTGTWIALADAPEKWSIRHERLVFELKPTPVGHLGLFPEQAENWDWIEEQIRKFAPRLNTLPKEEEAANYFRVLNLFAYTGGSTLAAAASGAAVTHLDAAKNIVGWAKQNAALSGLQQAPIRWIVDDALKFVKREVRRGTQYDALILDPPSYGHGASGEVWRLSKHLDPLLEQASQIAENCRLILLTCHTPGYEPDRLAEIIFEAFPRFRREALDARELFLYANDGRALPAGCMVRAVRE